ncbi:hypothetical protein D1007_41824 [Hordeum vulgare]|nr:hypothetical protein D1007_41824 [Hordeum vulgare]
MSDHTTDGGVADIYVEYNGEQDEEGGEESGSDFENEIDCLIESGSEDGDVPVVMSAYDDVPVVMSADDDVPVVMIAEETEIFEQVLVPNETGVITEISGAEHGAEHGADQPAEVSDSEEDDTDYVPHSDDSGEESKVVELRKHARKFRKKMKDSKKWIEGESNGAIPIDFIANVEEVKGHNKGSCKQNPNRNKKVKADLAKRGEKLRAKEV